MSDIAAPPPSAAPASPATQTKAPAASSPSPRTAATPAPQTQSKAPVSTAPNSKHADPPAEAPTGGETAAQKRARLLKLKVDGKVEEIDVESMSDEQLALDLQMSRAARKRMQEAAEIQKQYQKLREAIKADPFEALKDPAFGGLDVYELAQQRMVDEYQKTLMTPEQQEKLKLQQEAETYKKQLQEIRQRQEAEQRQVMEKKIFEETEREFTAALEASDLPKNHETVYTMAEIAKMNLEHGVEMTPQQIAHETKARLEGNAQRYIRSLKGDALTKFLGEEAVKEILRTEVKKVRGSQAAPPQAQAPAPVTTEADEQPPARRRMTSLRDFHRSLRGGK